MSSQAKKISAESKPKGRPPLEPRIAALEVSIYNLMQAVSLLIDRIDKLELKTSVAAPNIDMTYKPLFERWPGQSER